MLIEFLDMHPLQELVLVMKVEIVEQLKTIIYQKVINLKEQGIICAFLCTDIK